MFRSCKNRHLQENRTAANKPEAHTQQQQQQHNIATKASKKKPLAAPVLPCHQPPKSAAGTNTPFLISLGTPGQPLNSSGSSVGIQTIIRPDRSPTIHLSERETTVGNYEIRKHPTPTTVPPPCPPPPTPQDSHLCVSLQLQIYRHAVAMVNTSTACSSCSLVCSAFVVRRREGGGGNFSEGMYALTVSATPPSAHLGRGPG